MVIFAAQYIPTFIPGGIVFFYGPAAGTPPGDGIMLKAGCAMLSPLRAVGDKVDEFINDYLAANPK
jgi:hypothetical protein